MKTFNIKALNTQEINVISAGTMSEAMTKVAGFATDSIKSYGYIVMNKAQVIAPVVLNYMPIATKIASGVFTATGIVTGMVMGRTAQIRAGLRARCII